MFGKHFIIFCCFERIESNLSHLVTFWQDLRLPSYWITTDSPRCLNLSRRYSAFVQYCISWFDCLSFLRGLCCAVELLTPHRTEHRSKLLLDHRVTTFDFDRCSQHRSEPTAEAALLQSAFNAPDAPLANVILMKSATRHWQRRDAAAMRCDGDAIAMRLRCDRADGDPQKPARIRSRNRRKSGAVCEAISSKNTEG